MRWEQAVLAATLALGMLSSTTLEIPMERGSDATTVSFTNAVYDACPDGWTDCEMGHVDGPYATAGEDIDATPAAPECVAMNEPGVLLYYAYHAGEPNRLADQSDGMIGMVNQANGLSYSASIGGDHARMNVVCDNGTPVIRTLELDYGGPGSTTLSDIEAAVDRAYGADVYMIHAVYVDGGIDCDCAGAANGVRSGPAGSGPFSGMGEGDRLFALNDTLSATTFWHEWAHLVGAVGNSAPNSDGYAHCIDGTDIMCYRDDNILATKASQYSASVCSPAEASDHIDCNRNDYWNRMPQLGSFIERGSNIADPANPYMTFSRTHDPNLECAANGMDVTCTFDVPAGGRSLLEWESDALHRGSSPATHTYTDPYVHWAELSTYDADGVWVGHDWVMLDFYEPKTWDLGDIYSAKFHGEAAVGSSAAAILKTEDGFLVTSLADPYVDDRNFLVGAFWLANPWTDDYTRIPYRHHEEPVQSATAVEDVLLLGRSEFHRQMSVETGDIVDLPRTQFPEAVAVAGETFYLLRDVKNGQTQLATLNGDDWDIIPGSEANTSPGNPTMHRKLRILGDGFVDYDLTKTQFRFNIHDARGALVKSLAPSDFPGTPTTVRFHTDDAMYVAGESQSNPYALGHSFAFYRIDPAGDINTIHLPPGLLMPQRWGGLDGQVLAQDVTVEDGVRQLWLQVFSFDPEKGGQPLHAKAKLLPGHYLHNVDVIDGELIATGSDLAQRGFVLRKDIDPDGDGIFWPLDTCNEAPGPDHDRDGCSDATDADDDEDGVLDVEDACPRGVVGWSHSGHDRDGDGCHDMLDSAPAIDDDGPGAADGGGSVEEDEPSTSVAASPRISLGGFSLYDQSLTLKLQWGEAPWVGETYLWVDGGSGFEVVKTLEGKEEYVSYWPGYGEFTFAVTLDSEGDGAEATRGQLDSAPKFREFIAAPEQGFIDSVVDLPAPSFAVTIGAFAMIALARRRSIAD